MGVTQRQKRERERRAGLILDAAETVFTAKGFESATVDDIAAQAEYSKGTLYLYFRSKDEIWVAVLLRALSELPVRYREIAGQPGTGAEVVRRLLATYHRWVADHPDHFRIGMSWLLLGYSLPPDTPNFEEYRHLVGAMFQVLVDAIERGQRDGSLRGDLPAQSLAMQLWGASVGLLLLSQSKDEVARRVPVDFDFSRLTDDFIDTALRGLTPAPPECP